MPDGKKPMVEQQFKNNWDQISQLSTNLDCVMNLLSGWKVDICKWRAWEHEKVS